jgi:hypothetical protein
MGRECAYHEVCFTISMWIAAMLSNRIVRTEIRGISSTMMVRRGCPKGGVLSPLLYGYLFLAVSSEQRFADDKKHWLSFRPGVGGGG